MDVVRLKSEEWCESTAWRQDGRIQENERDPRNECAEETNGENFQKDTKLAHPQRVVDMELRFHFARPYNTIQTLLTRPWNLLEHIMSKPKTSAIAHLSASNCDPPQ